MSGQGTKYRGPHKLKDGGFLGSECMSAGQLYPVYDRLVSGGGSGRYVWIERTHTSEFRVTVQHLFKNYFRPLWPIFEVRVSGFVRPPVTFNFSIGCCRYRANNNNNNNRRPPV